MTNADEDLTVARRLGRLLERGLLPAGGPAEAAERLIERLERPARVALLGLPGCGKSAILNLLAGAVVVPEALRLPTIVVQHGTEPRMVCTLADGQTQVLPGDDLQQALALAPAMITLELDLPALRVISLLEVAAGPMETEQRRAALWAGKRADILIWCTTSYLPKEQLVWEGMPDVYKDNGFLLLTKIDLLGSREAAAGMHQRVEQRAGSEFRAVLPISAKEARAATDPSQQVDRERFLQSGASAVITTIKHRVQMARRSDTDTAELILARHEVAPAPAPEPAPVSPPAQVFNFAPPPLPVHTPPQITVPEPPRALLLDHAITVPEPVVSPDPEPVPVVPAAAGVGNPDLSAALAAADEEQLKLIRELLQVAPPVPVAPTPEPEAVEEPALPQAEEPPQPVEVPEPEIAPSSPTFDATAAKRLTDRLKRFTGEADSIAAPPVPLKATWKSRADLATPSPESASEPARPAPRPRATEIPAEARVPPRPGTVPAEPKVEPPAPVPEPMPVAEEPTEPLTLSGPELEPVREPVAEPVQDVTPEPPTPELPQEAVEDPALARFGALRDPRPAPPVRIRPESSAEPVERPRPATESRPGAEPAEPTSQDSPVAPRSGLAARLRASAPEGAMPGPERMARPPMTPRATVQPRLATAEELASPRSLAARDRRDDQPHERRERPRITPRVVAPAPGQQVAVPAADAALAEQAVRLVCQRSADLAGQIEPSGRMPVDLVLDHSRETTEQVLAILSKASSPVLRRISGGFGEAQDLIMLMQLEKGHAPADDALTLLLQLRRELETVSLG